MQLADEVTGARHLADQRRGEVGAVGQRVLGPVRVGARDLGLRLGPRAARVRAVVPGAEVEVGGVEEAPGLVGTHPGGDRRGRVPVDEHVAQVEDDPGRGGPGRAQAQRSEAGTKSSVRSPV